MYKEGIFYNINVRYEQIIQMFVLQLNFIASKFGVHLLIFHLQKQNHFHFNLDQNEEMFSYFIIFMKAEEGSLLSSLGQHPLTNQGLLIHFFDFVIAQVYLREIYIEAKIQCIEGSRGSPKWDSHFFSALSLKNFNFGQYTYDKHIIVF